MSPPPRTWIMSPGLTLLISTWPGLPRGRKLWFVPVARSQAQRGAESCLGPPRCRVKPQLHPGQVGKLPGLSLSCLWGLTGIAAPSPITVKRSVY